MRYSELKKEREIQIETSLHTWRSRILLGHGSPGLNLLAVVPQPVDDGAARLFVLELGQCLGRFSERALRLENA